MTEQFSSSPTRRRAAPRDPRHRNTFMWTCVDSVVSVDLAMVQAEILDAAREKLRALLSEEDRRKLKAQTVVRTDNSPAYAIVSYAKESKTDLIIMGTHGRSVAHLLMGRVAEKVLRIAPCPVLTVRSPEREFVLPDALQLVTAVRP